MPPPASSNPPRVAISGRLDGFLRSPLFAMQFLYLPHEAAGLVARFGVLRDLVAPSCR